MDTDYLGFSYNGIHYGPGSSIVIYRTSNNGRYRDELSPTHGDITQTIPGNDGAYYFGTNFNQKQFTIDFAFDNLKGFQIRELKQNFSKRNGIFPLIFDEQPYKTWMVKCTGTPYINAVCFDIESTDATTPAGIYHNHVLTGTEHLNLNAPTTSSTERVYKGEGQVTFTAYFPFAKSTHKWLNEYSDSAQWKDESGMKTSGTGYDTPNNSTGQIKLFNPGDMETDFIIYFNKAGDKFVNTITIGNNELSFNADALTGDTGVMYNSRTHLLEGYKTVGTEKVKTGNIYPFSGEYLTMKIPVITATSEDFYLTYEHGTGKSACAGIEYDYLYY